MSEVCAALSHIVSFRIRGGSTPPRPTIRLFKPNETWQRNQRKAARLAVNGYRTALLPNSDGTASVLCSLSYDLCDFYELCQWCFEPPDLDISRVPDRLSYVDWDYATLRVEACISALRRASVKTKLDPFSRLKVRGRNVRFVGWPTSSRTHLTEDSEEVRGASTLCGGRLAFHKHTQQQWTCYPCAHCRRVIVRTAQKVK